MKKPLVYIFILYFFLFRFIYYGKIDLTKLQGPNLLDLLIAVDELSIQTLISCTQEYLINHKFEFLQQNTIETLETVYQINQHDTFKGVSIRSGFYPVLSGIRYG